MQALSRWSGKSIPTATGLLINLTDICTHWTNFGWEEFLLPEDSRSRSWYGSLACKPLEDDFHSHSLVWREDGGRPWQRRSSAEAVSPHNIPKIRHEEIHINHGHTKCSSLTTNATHANAFSNIVSNFRHLLLDFPAQTGKTKQRRTLTVRPWTQHRIFQETAICHSAYSGEKPASGCRILICFTIVLFPDSPAPITGIKEMIP